MKTVVMKVLELFEESTITQSILVLSVFGVIIYCVVARVPIPDLMIGFGGTILGYFFGVKSTIVARKEVEKWKSQL